MSSEAEKMQCSNTCVKQYMEGTKIFINILALGTTVENKAECSLTTEAKDYMSSLKI